MEDIIIYKETLQIESGMIKMYRISMYSEMFGCKALSHIPNDERSTLSTKT